MNNRQARITKRAIQQSSAAVSGFTLPIVWINLLRATQRRQYMTEQLAGRTHYRVEAADKTVADTVLHAPPIVMAERRTELACLISHLKAIQLLADSDWPQALILEDDMQLMDYKALARALAQAPTDWGALQLFTESCS